HNNYPRCPSFFFYNHTPTPKIYTLSLHDALPILKVSQDDTTYEASRYPGGRRNVGTLASSARVYGCCAPSRSSASASISSTTSPDRKSTRLNSSHLVISYAVFCLKKKKQNNNIRQ